MVAQLAMLRSVVSRPPGPRRSIGDQTFSNGRYVRPARASAAFVRGAQKQSVHVWSHPGRLRNDCDRHLHGRAGWQRTDMDARDLSSGVRRGEGRLRSVGDHAADRSRGRARLARLLRTREDHADVRRPVRFADRSDLVAGHGLCVVAGRRPFDFIRAPYRTRRSPGGLADAGADRRRAQHAAADPGPARSRSRADAAHASGRCHAAGKKQRAADSGSGTAGRVKAWRRSDRRRAPALPSG